MDWGHRVCLRIFLNQSIRFSTCSEKCCHQPKLLAGMKAAEVTAKSIQPFWVVRNIQSILKEDLAGDHVGTFVMEWKDSRGILFGV